MKPHIKKLNNLWQCCTPSRVSEWAVGLTPEEAYKLWDGRRKDEEEYQKLLYSAVKHLQPNRMYLYKGAS